MGQRQLPPTPVPFLGARGRQYQGLWNQVGGMSEFQGWNWPRDCVSLLLLGWLECASQGDIMLAGGRLTVQGGAKFAFELERADARSQSVFHFLRCSNQGRWSSMEQGVLQAPKASQSVAPGRELFSNGIRSWGHSSVAECLQAWARPPFPSLALQGELGGRRRMKI